MKNLNLPIDSPTQSLSIQLTNLSPKDAQFLSGVIKLFCDPQFEVPAQLVREGQRALQYLPEGDLLLPPIFSPERRGPKKPVQHTTVPINQLAPNS